MEELDSLNKHPIMQYLLKTIDLIYLNFDETSEPYLDFFLNHLINGELHIRIYLIKVILNR
jgi:hypothetical protein